MYTKCAASARRIAAVLEAPETFPVTEDDDLLKTCPEYKQISDSQMGGAILD